MQRIEVQQEVHACAPRSLIAPLQDGPIDIIGDVHGEIDALRAVLTTLGYNSHGEHPRGRRLVFVGDLVDRGPDSPAVVELVASLVERDLAQCIVGNHELSVLRGEPRPGNAWIIDSYRQEQQPGGEFAHSRVATESLRQRCRAFMDSLPVALVREDLRIVHAAWQASDVRTLATEAGPVTAVYSRYEGQLLRELAAEGVLQQARSHQWRNALRDRNASASLLAAIGQADERYQKGNPVRVLTSGIERPTLPPSWSNGQWRLCDRVPWWDAYDEEPPVVIGHYWRRLRPPQGPAPAGSRPDLFAGSGPLDWLGPRRNVFCVDYSVGARYVERQVARRRTAFETQLCALRWPERELWAEDGPVSLR